MSNDRNGRIARLAMSVAACGGLREFFDKLCAQAELVAETLPSNEDDGKGRPLAEFSAALARRMDLHADDFVSGTNGHCTVSFHEMLEAASVAHLTLGRNGGMRKGPPPAGVTESDKLVASVLKRGVASKLTPEQRSAFSASLKGILGQTSEPEEPAAE